MTGLASVGTSRSNANEYMYISDAQYLPMESVAVYLCVNMYIGMMLGVRLKALPRYCTYCTTYLPAML